MDEQKQGLFDRKISENIKTFFASFRQFDNM